MNNEMLNTENGLDVLCDLTPYVVDIVTDEKLIAEIKSKAKVTEDTTRNEQVKLIGEKIKRIVPLVVKEKKDSVCGIVAVLNGKSVDEVKKQSVFLTIRECLEIVTDRDLVDFFKFCTDGVLNG